METAVLDLIGRIYDSAASRADWSVTLERFADLAGAEAANMLIVSPKTGQATVISPEMHRIYHAILPHMIRSVEMQWRLHRLELERAMARASDDAGVLVVNSDSRVLVADGLAEAILSRGAPLRLENGTLCALDPDDTRSIRQMVTSCQQRRSGYHLRGGAARITYPGSDALEIAIMPVPSEHTGFAFDVEDNAQPAAIILLEDIAARGTRMLEQIQRRYGLTRTEARVAAECLKGQPRETLAATLGVSDSTVRTHLSRIYEKTGTSRRPELVSLLFRDGFSPIG